MSLTTRLHTGIAPHARSLRLLASAATVAIALTACGGGDDDPAATPAAGSTSSATGVAQTPGAAPTVDPTEEALAESLGGLATLVLVHTDVPEAYALTVNQPVARREAAVSNVGIPTLATFLNVSDLEGAWVAFFVRPQPETSLASRVYAFAQPASAVRFVDTLANLKTTDYPAATAVERAQADKIGEAAQMMVYRVPGSRTLEYTWAQGRFAGQIVLRYPGDTDNPGDIALVVSLARKQFDRMQAGLP